MAEWHDNGYTKEQNYANAKRQVNQKFDTKLSNKSFFTSKRSIEEDRKAALSEVESNYYGNQRGGGFAME